MGLKEGLDSAAAESSTSETQSPVACRWCGLYSAPGPACELCGSPLIDVPWLQIPQLIGPDGPSGPPSPRPPARRESEPPNWPVETDDDALPPASVSVAPLAIEQPQPVVPVEPAVEPAVEPVHVVATPFTLEAAPEPDLVVEPQTVEAPDLELAEPVIEPAAPALEIGLPVKPQSESELFVEPPPPAEEAPVPVEPEPQPEPVALVLEVEPQTVETQTVEPPAVEQPVVEQPVVQQPAVEQPVVQQLAVEQPVVEQPVVEQPVVEAIEAPPSDPIVDIELPPRIDGDPVVPTPPAPLDEALSVSEEPLPEPQPLPDSPPVVDQAVEEEPTISDEPRRRRLPWRKREPAAADAPPSLDSGAPTAEGTPISQPDLVTALDMAIDSVIEEVQTPPATEHKAEPELETDLRPLVEAAQEAIEPVEEVDASPTTAIEVADEATPEAIERPAKRPRLGWLGRRRETEAGDDRSLQGALPEPPADAAAEASGALGQISIESDAMVQAEPPQLSKPSEPAEPPQAVQPLPLQRTEPTRVEPEPRPVEPTAPERPSVRPTPRPKPRPVRPAVPHKPAASTPPAPSKPIVERPAPAAPPEEATPREALRLDATQLWGTNERDRVRRDAAPPSPPAPRATPASSGPPTHAPPPDRAVDLVSAASSILEELSALVASHRPEAKPAEPPAVPPKEHIEPTRPVEPPKVFEPAPQPQPLAQPDYFDRPPAARAPSDAEEWTRMPPSRPATVAKKDRRGARLPWRRRKDEEAPAMDGLSAAAAVSLPSPMTAATTAPVGPPPVPSAGVPQPAPRAKSTDISCPRCGQPSPRGLCEACEDALLQLRQLTAAIYQD